MHAASRAAREELRPRLDAVSSSARSDSKLAELADELYAVAELLTRQPRLRRLLADPATPAEGRSRFVASLLDGKVAGRTLELVQFAVSLRWSSPWDLLDALETAGDDVLLAAAEKQGSLTEVEDQLFRFERILDAESSLTTLLDEAGASAGRRRDLLGRVVGDKVHPITRALLEHAVGSERKRSIVLAIDDLIEAAAARRDRSVARVASATAMSDEQQSELADVLSRMYGRSIEVRYAIEPAIRGGLVVRVGDEIIDGSVTSRLNKARTAFAT